VTPTGICAASLASWIDVPIGKRCEAATWSSALYDRSIYEHSELPASDSHIT